MEEKEVKKVANEATESKDEKKSKKKGLLPKKKTIDLLKNKKAWIVNAILTIACIAFILWLFKPSPKSEKGAKGFNTEMPDADSETIEEDKRKAYATADLQKRQEEKRKAMGSLGELFGGEMEDSVVVGNDGFSLIGDAPKPTKEELHEANSIRLSAAACQDLNTTLGSFYEQPQNNDTEKDELSKRIDELETEMMNVESNRQSSVDEQVALMEKSYQLAAKYLPNGNSSAVGNATQKVSASKKPTASPVRQVHTQVVSSLVQPMDNEEFVEAFAERADAGFKTAVGSDDVSVKNTISACVHGNQTITDGQTVRLRLLEAMCVEDRIIPRNTIVIGIARMQGERLGISLSSIEYEGNIIPIGLSVYDTDGQEGIFIPNSLEIEAAKEIGANMGSSLNSSINISANAGAQLASDLGKGVIQGVSQYISKRMRTVKVHLKAGYKVLLYQEDK